MKHFLTQVIVAAFLLNLLSSSCGSQFDYTELAQDKSNGGQSLPFHKFGCRHELRQIASEVGYPKLYERVITGSTELNKIPNISLSALALDQDFVKAVQKLHSDFDVANLEFAKRLAESPCIHLIAQLNNMESAEFKKQLLNDKPVMVGAEAGIAKLAEYYDKIASRYEPKRKPVDFTVFFFIPYQALAEEPRFEVNATPVFDTAKHFNVLPLIAMSGVDTPTLEKIRVLQKLSNEYVKKAGYFGYWEDSTEFEIAWGKSLTQLNKELEKCHITYGQETPSKLLTSRLVSYNSAAPAPEDCSEVHKTTLYTVALVLEAAAEAQEDGDDDTAKFLLESAQEGLKVVAEVAIDFSPAGRIKGLVEGLTMQSIMPPDFEQLTYTDAALSLAGAVTIGSGGAKLLGKAVTYIGKTRTIAVIGKFCKSSKASIEEAYKLTGKIFEAKWFKRFADRVRAGKVDADGGTKLFDRGASVHNPLPSDGVFVRAVPRDLAKAVKEGKSPFNQDEFSEAFVAAYDDMKHITDPKQIAERLSLYKDKAGTALRNTSDYVLVKFKSNS